MPASDSPTNTVLVLKHPAASWKIAFSAGELAALLSSMLHRAGINGVTVELTLLDDSAMEALNRQAMGCAGPTNILSFPAAYAPDPEGMAGDFLGSLALSGDTLRREAFLYGQDAEGYCLRLLAHGLAHLLGFDHGPEMDTLADAMQGVTALKRSGTPP